MEELFKVLNSNLRNLLIRKALSEIAKRFAFLTWGPIGWIVEKCVTYIVDVIMEQANLFVTDKIVENSVENQVDAVEKVTDRLIEYEENVENYTKEEADALDEDLMAAYRDLFRF